MTTEKLLRKESEDKCMDYLGISLHDLLQIDILFTIHYFEYSSEFYFAGESHNFWEFICVDKGNVNICMDETEITLHKGEIAFHQPNEFHKVVATGATAPNLVVISFKCDSPAMDFFRKKVLTIDERERSILAMILKEAKKLFISPLNDPYLKEMKKNPSVPLGTEQLIKLHLQHFLIHLLRRNSEMSIDTPMRSSKNTLEIFKRVVDYMENNLSEHLSIEQICYENMIGRTQLQKIFNEECGYSVIEYFSKMKIESAKHLIRNGKMNFTQISEQLGYTSIHYFSRQFKKVSGMTPSEYASSIKAIAEKKD